MKTLLLALALLPTLALADVDPNIQQRIDDATQNTPGGARYQPGFPDYGAAPRHGVGYSCYAKDAQGRLFQSTWVAGSLDLAKQYALRRCGFFWNKGCRLVKCGKQRY